MKAPIQARRERIERQERTAQMEKTEQRGREYAERTRSRDARERAMPPLADGVAKVEAGRARARERQERVAQAARQRVERERTGGGVRVLKRDEPKRTAGRKRSRNRARVRGE